MYRCNGTIKSRKSKIKKGGLTRLNTPKRTPNHKTKKAVVAVRVGGKIKIIRFGAQGMGHNYSPEARRSFKARHAKNIAKGRVFSSLVGKQSFLGRKRWK